MRARGEVLFWYGRKIELVFVNGLESVSAARFFRFIPREHVIAISFFAFSSSFQSISVAQLFAQNPSLFGKYLHLVALGCTKAMVEFRLVRTFVKAVYEVLAERGGFEPPIGFNPYNGLANRRFRPLSHLSASGPRVSAPNRPRASFFPAFALSGYGVAGPPSLDANRCFADACTYSANGAQSLSPGQRPG